MADPGYLRLKSNKAGAVGVVISNGATTTGMKILRDGTELPASMLNGVFVDSIDTLGALLVGASESNVDLTFALLVDGSVQSALAGLYAEARACMKYGGVLRYKPAGSTGFVERAIESASVPDAWSADAEAFDHMFTVLQVTVAPFAESDGLDIEDDFSTDTLGTGGKYNLGGSDWTLISGNTPTISGGMLNTPTTTGYSDWRHTGSAIERTDCEVTAKFRFAGAHATAKYFGLFAKWLDASNHISAYAYSTSASAWTLNIQTRIHGTNAAMTSTSITTITADTDYWMRVRVEGNVITAEWWATEPTPMGTPTHTITDVFTSTEAAVFGRRVSGDQGIFWDTAASGSFGVSDFRVLAHNYRSVVTPEVITLGGDVPGDVEAKADLVVTASGSSASAAPVWAGFAWMPQPATTNVVHNSGFETDASGWVATAVSGVIAAATSVTRVTSGVLYEGAASLEIVCPATTDTGGSFAIYRRFKKGVKYIAECYMWSAAGTTVARVKLGASGNLGTGTSIALTTTPTRRSVAWIPSADVDTAYFAAGIAAATATTFRIDSVMVYEAGALAPVYADPYDGDPVAEFALGEASGNVTSHNGTYTGTVAGNPTYGKRGPIPGDATTCMDFDGTVDAITITNDANIGAAKWSLETWFMRDVDTGAQEYIFDNRGSLTGYGLFIGSTDILAVSVGDGAAYSSSLGPTISTGVWYHVVATYDGTNVRIYVSGGLESVTADAYTPRTTGTSLIAAQSGGAQNFSGKIARLRIYNRALTGDEIARRAVGPPPALTAGGEIPFGVINAASADFTNVGSFFGTVPASDADYRSGFNIDGSGDMSTNATAEWYLLPFAVTPDEYSRGEYAAKIFARVEIASTQVDVNICASLAPEGGTSYGARRYTQEWGSRGRSVAAPDSGTVFRNVFLGTVVMRVDRNRPTRWKLKLDCVNDPASTGVFGIDTIIIMPARRMCSGITGVPDANHSPFISSVSQTTKRIKHNKRCEISNPASTISREAFPDGGLGGANILLPNEACQLLAWVTDYQPDRADENDAGAAESVSATVQVSVKPQHLFVRE